MTTTRPSLGKRLGRFRRRLKLTRNGRFFIAISIGVGLAAINTGNNLLYLLLGWLLSLIIASGAMSNATLRGLAIRRRLPPRIFAGAPFAVEFLAENTKKRRASYSISVTDFIEAKGVDKRCYFLRVGAGQTQSASYRHTFARRGRYRFDGVSLTTRFPFGLFEKSRRLSSDDQVVVFPAVEPIRLPTPQGRQQGELRGGKVGRRGEFFGLREYRDGDNHRAIHWRSSARRGRLLVREYEEEAQRRATILVDNALPGAADATEIAALEAAISLAASLAVAYAQRGYALRLLARGVLVPFASGEPQLYRILRRLALLEPSSAGETFSGESDPSGESVLCVGRGLPYGRPAGVDRVMEAG